MNENIIAAILIASIFITLAVCGVICSIVEQHTERLEKEKREHGRSQTH